MDISEGSVMDATCILNSEDLASTKGVLFPIVLALGKEELLLILLTLRKSCTCERIFTLFDDTSRCSIVFVAFGRLMACVGVTVIVFTRLEGGGDISKLKEERALLDGTELLDNVGETVRKGSLGNPVGVEVAFMPWTVDGATKVLYMSSVSRVLGSGTSGVILGDSNML